MKCQITNFENKKVGEISLNAEIFDHPLRVDILNRMVIYQLAKRQSGNHHTKSIQDISGTTKKPHSQKGTGRARQGSLRSAQMRGGAVIFGPKTRSHAIDLPKKVRAMALKVALSSKMAQGNLMILEDFNLKGHKTQDFVKSIQALGFKTALFIDGPEVSQNIKLAASNVKGVDVLPQQGINVYDILRREKLILTRSAVESLENRLK